MTARCSGGCSGATVFAALRSTTYACWARPVLLARAGAETTCALRGLRWDVLYCIHYVSSHQRRCSARRRRRLHSSPSATARRSSSCGRGTPGTRWSTARWRRCSSPWYHIVALVDRSRGSSGPGSAGRMWSERSGCLRHRSGCAAAHESRTLPCRLRRQSWCCKLVGRPGCSGRVRPSHRHSTTDRDRPD